MADSVKKTNTRKGSEVSSKRDESLLRASSHRCVEYWILRGHSEKSAKMMVSKGQVTFSLKTCIEKYGKEEGEMVWEDRQNRWMNTMNQKTQEEKDRINKLKISKGFVVSEPETDILEEVVRAGIDVTPQFVVRHPVTNKRKYTCDFRYENKIIEFFGDYWHCNPKEYGKEFIHSRKEMTAEEVWEEDSQRIKFLESLGFSVKVVWENDYRHDREKVIEECINFLK